MVSRTQVEPRLWSTFQGLRWRTPCKLGPFAIPNFSRADVEPEECSPPRSESRYNTLVSCRLIRLSIRENRGEGYRVEQMKLSSRTGILLCKEI